MSLFIEEEDIPMLNVNSSSLSSTCSAVVVFLALATFSRSMPDQLPVLSLGPVWSWLLVVQYWLLCLSCSIIFFCILYTLCSSRTCDNQFLIYKVITSKVFCLMSINQVGPIYEHKPSLVKTVQLLLIITILISWT